MNPTGQTTTFRVLSEHLCGMTLDGAMNVYTQEWSTTVSVDDERLTDTGKLESEQGWIETIIACSTVKVVVSTKIS